MFATTACRVELRVVVPARHVPERGRDQPVRRLARPSSRRRVVTPGLEMVPLDPVERRADGLVVGVHHRPPAVVEGLQRDRLRGRERHVPAGTVLALAVDDAAQRDVRAGDLARQDRDELPLAHTLAQSQGLGALAVPPVGGAVGAVVPREVLVHEVAEGLPGAGKLARAGEHQPASAAEREVGGDPVTKRPSRNQRSRQPVCPVPLFRGGAS